MAGETMTHPYTSTDAMFQVLRLLVLGGITVATSSVVSSVMGHKSAVLVNFLILLLSFFQYYLVNLVLNSCMWTMFKCEALNAHDYSFLLEEKNNSHTIMGAGVFEKFEFEPMKKYLLEKAEHIHKCKSKLVKKFGVFWYQLMTDEEWKQAAEYLVVEKTGIKSAQELRECVCEEQANYDFYERPQFKFILIPDYINNQSVVVLKIHHSFTDGLGIATFF
jgi:hypothetical protein